MEMEKNFENNRFNFFIFTVFLYNFCVFIKLLFYKISQKPAFRKKLKTYKDFKIFKKNPLFFIFLDTP